MARSRNAQRANVRFQDDTSPSSEIAKGRLLCEGFRMAALARRLCPG